MRVKFLLIILFSASTALVTAQNKTLGVGTATPNANAALHVESPTNNQGFIMPRLTTAQRTAMGSLLVVGDNGLMLYDTDLKTIFIWDGTKWNTTAQVAGGPKLQYPYEDLVTVPTGTPDLFALRYNNPENKRVLRLENQSGTNGSSTLSVLNQGVGIAGYFQTQNVASTSSTLYATTNSDAGGVLAPVAVYGESTGTGSLGAAFWNRNATNNFPALYTRNEGLGSAASFEITLSGNSASGVYSKTVGTGAAVLGDNLGNGFGVHGKSAGTIFATAAVYGEHTGTGDAAGAFRINNAGNTFSALYGETNGSGPAVYGMQIGNSNASAGYFQQGDATRTTGTGPAVFGAQLGLGRAGQFQIGNAANAEAALRSFTNGTGRAGFFTISNASNPSEAIFATTNGTGSAGNFTITNAASTSPALHVETNGAGVSGNFINNGTTFAIYAQAKGSTDAIYSRKMAGDGVGSAGNFVNEEPNNGASTLFAMTNASGGSALGAINSANGSALAIFQGGMKVSTHTLSAGTTITTRAIAYNITGGGPYTFSLTPALTDGEMFFFYNATASPVTVSGAAIPANSGLLFIVLGGTPRPF